MSRASMLNAAWQSHVDTKKGDAPASPFPNSVVTRRSVVQEAPEFAGAARVLELAQRLGFDLADTLAGHRELLADLFQV